MLPSASPERAAKRPRTTAVDEARTHTCAGTSGGSGGGQSANTAAAAQLPSSAPLQPLLQKPRPQSQSHKGTAKAQSQSQPRQSQSQAHQSQIPQPQFQSRPSQPSLKPQSQPQPGPAMVLANGAVSVLPTALPTWAEEAFQGVDPFWRSKETLAVISTQQAAPAPGTYGQLQSASALFTVSPSALEAIAEKKAQARLVCVQPKDGLPRRCHWYGGSYVLLNHRPYDVTKEDRVQLLLGDNQADRAADLSGGLVRGANRLTLLWPTGVAGAVAALRLCEPRSASELKSSLAPPLPLQQAVAMIKTYIAGGKPAANADAAVPRPGVAAPQAPHCGIGGPDTDTDGEGALGAGPVTVSLRCPLHGGLATAPAHFGAMAAASPLAFFDLEPFLELARGSGSWVCPASGRLGELRDLRPHAFLSAVLRTLEHNGVRSRVEAIEVAPCGGWRPKDSRLPFLSALDADPTDLAGRSPPSFDPRLLDPEDGGAAAHDVVDLTED